MNESLIVVTAVLLTALLYQSIILMRYRRQIREVCRQLSFHQKNQTNQEIRIDVSTKEIQELQDKINQIFVQCKELEIQHQNSEENLKDVITNISHDIRTPLTSIHGYFQLMCETNEETERKKYADIITRRICSMEVLLEQLFTYVRVQNDGFTVTATACDIKQQLCENLFSFYEDFRQKGIEPKVELPDSAISVFLDVELFSRVLQNILKNALVHGTDEIDVTLKQKEQKVILTIQNRTREEHCPDPQMVFTRFYQGDKSRSTGSTGLGLCIAKELVEKMDGEIQAYYQDEYFGIEITFNVLQ